MQSALWLSMLAATLGVAPASQSQPATEAPAVGRYEVLEVTLGSEERFADPLVDATADGTFLSPSGRKVQVPGFHAGRNEWIVRFAPDEAGEWTYTARLSGGKEAVHSAGRFRCTESSRHGFLRRSKVNPYRMQYDDSTPFYPIGIHLCNALHPEHDGPGVDGKWRSVDIETWCKDFAGAVNLHRVQLGLGNSAGCALPVLKGIEDGRIQIDYDLAGRLDDMYRTHGRYGFSQILILYQDMSLWGNADSSFGKGRDLENYKSVRASNLRLQEQYIRYIVARYGAFVDIWEIYNEDSFSPEEYLAHLAGVIRQADPYHHLVTTTYERPQAEWCDLVTPHEYIGIPASETDAYLCTQLLRFKSFGKPVQYTEFGNQRTLSNVDPVKWRIATWTAFLNECGILFWGQSGSKLTGSTTAPGNSNAYIGAEDRGYFRILQDFTRDLPIDIRPVASGYTDQKHLRTYALGNGRTTVLYVHHFSDHETAYKLPDKLFVATGPGKHKFRWLDPATGRTVAEGTVETPQLFAAVEVPPVKIDLACRFERLP